MRSSDLDGADATPAGADALGQVDAGIAGDAGPSFVTLSETSPDVATAAAMDCTNTPDTQTYDGEWYRIYPLSDPYFGLSSSAGFLVTNVAFSVWRTEGTVSVRVSVGTYTGSFPTASNLDETKVSSMGSKTVSLPSITGGALYSVQISPGVLVPAGAKMAISVSAASGGLQLGATAGNADWTNGFFNSSMCSITPAHASHGMIITVTGMPQ